MARKSGKRLCYSRGRWRDARGRFAPTPTLAQLPKDKRGRPRDARGRLVPARAVILPPPPPKPITVRAVSIAEPIWSTIDAPFVSKRFPNFSHMNRGNMSDLQAILENTFAAHAKKGDIDPDDMRVYEFGVLIRPGGKIDNRTLARVTDALEGTDARVLLVRESAEDDSIQIRFGDPQQPGYFDEVVDSFYSFEGALTDVYYAFDEFSDLEWAVFWETDEQAYDEEAA
jgi:hypothetical protein